MCAKLMLRDGGRFRGRGNTGVISAKAPSGGLKIEKPDTWPVLRGENQRKSAAGCLEKYVCSNRQSARPTAKRKMEITHSANACVYFDLEVLFFYEFASRSLPFNALLEAE